MILGDGGRDADIIAKQLEGAGLTVTIACATAVIAAYRAGDLAVAVTTADAVALLDAAELVCPSTEEPPCPDSTFIVLSDLPFSGRSYRQLAGLLGGGTVLVLPFDQDILVASVRSALRARARQWQRQECLLAREALDTQVRDRVATLERRVEERSEALLKAMAETARAQRRLRDSEALYRYTIELSSHTPWIASADGQMLSLGPGWANHGEARDWTPLVHPDDLGDVASAWTRSVDTATPFVHDFRLRGGDGRFGWCRARAAAQLTFDGSVERWYGTLEDIDENRVAAAKLRQLQAELIHVSRLGAMGTMASTLAHELNQPLTAIAGYVRGSRRLLSGHPDFRRLSDALDLAERSTVRAGEIVHRVRDLVTKGDVKRRHEDLAALIREACSLAMIDASSCGIDFRLEVTNVPVSVLVDRVQIQQVLLNLLRNAAEAVATGPRRQITVTAAIKTDEFCEVVVSDSGPELAAASIGRLFEPFNTTKSNGMGVGLSISRTIIEAHGGVIWHRPAPRGGAEFGFSLVRDQSGASPHPALQPVPGA